jgi:four helix bundle protein
MKDFRKLKVWEKAHSLVLTIYKLTLGLPTEERFGLTLQMRRSATAIPTSIAQGCGCTNDQDFARCVQSALRSGSELEYQLILCRDLLYVSPERIGELESELVEVKKMLVVFHQRLNEPN